MDEKKRIALWEEYARTKSSKIREKLILEYAGLVKIVAGRLGMYLGYTVEYDDLVGYGIFGLIDAIDKFELSKGVKFETYASLRIRGAIIDQIRKMDWIPRTIRQKQKKIETAMQELERELGRTPNSEELAEYLEVTVEEVEQMISQANLSSLISLDEYLEQGSDVYTEPSVRPRFDQPEQVVDRQETKRILAEAIDKLTEKEQKVIALYYFEELTLKEISNVLEVSESRVSQLHTKALKKMKERLGDQIDLFGIGNI